MLTLLLLHALASAAASATNLPPSLAQAVKVYDKAQWSGDRDLLSRSLAYDYVLINSGGKAETKAMFISELTDPAFKLKPFEVKNAVERIWAGGAVTGGVALLEGSDHGNSFSACLRFSDVWALRRGRWQVVYTHSSRAKPEDCA